MLVVVAENGIVGRQNGATAIAEYRIDVFVREYLHHDVGARHACTGEWMLMRLTDCILLVHGATENSLDFGVLAECLLNFIALQYWRNCANIREGRCGLDRLQT